MTPNDFAVIVLIAFLVAAIPTGLYLALTWFFGDPVDNRAGIPTGYQRFREEFEREMREKRARENGDGDGE